MCRKLILLTSVFLVLGLTAATSAQPIAVVNPGFEDPVLDENGYTWLDVPGWTQVDANGAGVWNVTLEDFDPVMAPEGENVLYTENAVGAPGGVAQVLAETFAADTDYTLTVEVGNSWYYYNGGYSVQLLAGGVVIAEDNDSLWPDYMTWATSTVAYTYDPNDELLVGEPLEIRLLNLALDKDAPPADTAVGVEFDDVRLSIGGPDQPTTYVWNGSAGDGLWETPGNWTVTNSPWTWPNEEQTSDPNGSPVFINMDALVIDIINGDAVTRSDGLRIQGNDGVTPAVLTLDGGSSLSVAARLSVGKSPGDQPQVGELNVLGGSTLTILDNNLQVADDPGSTGTVNIVGSTVEVAGGIVVDEGEGTINITDSTIITGDHINIGNNEGGVGYLTIDGASVIDTGGSDIEAGDGGEAHVVLTGDTTYDGDDIYVNEKPGGPSTLEISGNVVCNIDTFEAGEEAGVATIVIGGNAVMNIDDIMCGEKVGAEAYLTVTDNATLNLLDDMEVGEEDGSSAVMTVTGNAVLNIGDDVWIADEGGSTGHMIITGNATVNAPDEFYLADDPTAHATLDVNGTATFNVGDDLDVGEDGPAICNIGGDAVVTVGDTIYIPHHQQGIEASMTISGNATVSADDIQVVNDGGNSGFLHISGNPTVTMRLFYMNNDAGDPGTSEVIMDGGTVTVAEDATINDDNNGTATFTLNGGVFYAGDDIYVSDNLDGTAHLTINGGKMIAADDLKLGEDGGEDVGQARIFMNGGLLQAGGLANVAITDSQIVFAGGTLAIGSDSVSEEGMQQLIDDGLIVTDRNDLFISTITTIDGDFTILSEPLVAAWNPSPVSGAQVWSTPVTDTYISSDVPKKVPDAGGNINFGIATSTLNVPDAVKITDLNVELNIRMPANNADLNVYLTSPDGKTVELFTDVGFRDDDFKDTILDDEAPISIRAGRQRWQESW
jgi:hypothetical protein